MRVALGPQPQVGAPRDEVRPVEHVGLDLDRRDGRQQLIGELRRHLLGLGLEIRGQG